MKSASCSEAGILFKASCASSFSWKYKVIHYEKLSQALCKTEIRKKYIETKMECLYMIPKRGQISKNALNS